MAVTITALADDSMTCLPDPPALTLTPREPPITAVRPAVPVVLADTPTAASADKIRRPEEVVTGETVTVAAPTERLR